MYSTPISVYIYVYIYVKIILHERISLENDIYYKPANTHDYLPFDSAYPDHTRKTSPTT